MQKEIQNRNLYDKSNSSVPVKRGSKITATTEKD